MPGGRPDGICKYAQSKFILDTFVFVSKGEFDEDSRISEGFDCQVGELESWISDYSTSRQMTLSHDSMANYRECTGVIKTVGGEILPSKTVAFDLTQKLLSSICYM